MSRRSQPTARQIRLGSELKKLRERAEITAREAARLTGTDHTRLSHIEAGRVAVSPDSVRGLAAEYGVAGETLSDALADMAGERFRGWWEQYRGLIPEGFLDLAELEQHATFMRAVEITQIPGILQTEEHARAVFEQGMPPGHGPSDLAARVGHRMARRSRLEEDSATPYEAVIHEAALRIRAADRKLASRQLAALVEASERENITLRVIPFDTDGFATAGYSMLYVGGPVPQLDTVQLDAVHSGVLIDDEAQLKRHRDLYDRVCSHSLEPDESRVFMHRIAGEL